MRDKLPKNPSRRYPGKADGPLLAPRDEPQEADWEAEPRFLPAENKKANPEIGLID